MMTEFIKQLTTPESAKAYLILLVLVAAVVVWIRGTSVLSAKMAGWKNLVEKFPATDIERPGDTFKNQTGWIGNTEFRRTFNIQLLQEGIRVCPNFARRSPIMVPWSKITGVAVSEARVVGVQQNVLLTAEWEKLLQFSLPPKVLPTVEANVPADHFRKVEITPLVELVKERWKNRERG
jgi:hypothetical protein